MLSDAKQSPEIWWPVNSGSFMTRSFYLFKADAENAKTLCVCGRQE